MGTDVTVAIINMIGLIISAGVGYAAHAWYLHLKQKKINSFKTIIPIINEVYEILNELKNKTRAKRVIILKTTNGGGRPRIGGKLFSTAIYETFDSPLLAVSSGWNNQEVDEEYLKMLLELISSNMGHITVRLDEMDQNSLLANVYNSHGVQKSEIFKLAEKETAMYYVTINFVEDVELTSHEKEAIRISVNHLSKIFTRHEKL